MAVTIKSKEEIQCMRDAGKILAEVHEKLAEIIAPGITSLEIDRKGEELIRNAGCIPSFKGYEGYPASICVSINDEVVHGIPSKEHHLFDGDIVSLDAGVIYKGYQSDAARTHGVGTIDAEAKRLIEVTKESFFRGIAFASRKSFVRYFRSNSEVCGESGIFGCPRFSRTWNWNRDA